jgi:hypothetical protein
MITRLTSLTLLYVLLLPTIRAQYPTSPKRGLCYVSSADNPSDNSIWKTKSDLTWYYNYSPFPTASFSNSSLSFVPMLWGATNSTPSGDSDATPSFYYQILALLDSGEKVEYVLGFNEPDGNKDTGGSDISPTLAVAVWKAEIQPLKEEGIKLGLPATTGSPGGLDWLGSFLEECDGDCEFDFVPVHWYGNFEGLASHIGQIRAKLPKKPIWVTEYGFPHVNLTESQSFFNESQAYLGRLTYVERHSWFGAFRSDVSNVGANEAMLDQDGKLTDIGSWYLGGGKTGNVPEGFGMSMKMDGLKGWGVLLLGWAVCCWVDVWIG